MSAISVRERSAPSLAAVAAYVPWRSRSRTPQCRVIGIRPEHTGPTFNLVASADYISQPDGAHDLLVGLRLRRRDRASRRSRQLPDDADCRADADRHRRRPVTVTLTNNLPRGAGNTSIVFPGFQVTASGGVAGLLTPEAATGRRRDLHLHRGQARERTRTTAARRPTLQIEMGLYGALIVVPTHVAHGDCAKGRAVLAGGDRLRPSRPATTASTCSSSAKWTRGSTRPREAQGTRARVGALSPIIVTTEPYHPNYFLVNGRSMPDVMDTPYSTGYPHQPYNATRTCTRASWC